MDKQKETNVREYDFSSGIQKPVSSPVHKKQTNPIQKNFVNLVFSKLRGDKLDYKSCSDFKPKDLR